MRTFKETMNLPVWKSDVEAICTNLEEEFYILKEFDIFNSDDNLDKLRDAIPIIPVVFWSPVIGIAKLKIKIRELKEFTTIVENQSADADWLLLNFDQIVAGLKDHLMYDPLWWNKALKAHKILDAIGSVQHEIHLATGKGRPGSTALMGRPDYHPCRSSDNILDRPSDIRQKHAKQHAYILTRMYISSTTEQQIRDFIFRMDKIDTSIAMRVEYNLTKLLEAPSEDNNVEENVQALVDSLNSASTTSVQPKFELSAGSARLMLEEDRKTGQQLATEIYNNIEKVSPNNRC